MAKKMVKSRAKPKTNVKAKSKSKPKSRSKPVMKLDKKSPLLAVSKDVSNMQSDEPDAREGSFTPELANEDDIEEEEDAEGKSFYGKREEGI